MNESIVAHFYLAEVGQDAYNPAQLSVTLRVVSKGEENKKWAAATPTGELKMGINNSAATEIFRTVDAGYALGAEYELVLRKLPATTE